MTRISNTILAGIALATAGVVSVAGAQPRLEQTGDGYSVVHEGAEGRGSGVGGGAARITGGGEDATILYTGPDPVREGRWASLSGGGDGAEIVYGESGGRFVPRG